jgi:hypothetical protein
MNPDLDQSFPTEITYFFIIIKNIINKKKHELAQSNTNSILPLALKNYILSVVFGLLKSPKSELVFTDLNLQILHWIYEISIHCGVLILDLPTNIVYQKYIISFWQGIGLFLVCFGYWGNA